MGQRIGSDPILRIYTPNIILQLRFLSRVSYDCLGALANCCTKSHISNGLISRFLSRTCAEVSVVENIGQCGRLS